MQPSRRPSGSGSPARRAAPARRRRPAPARSTPQTAARRDLHGLAAARPAAAGAADPAAAARPDRRRAAAAVPPGARARRRPRRSGCRCAWLLLGVARLPVCWSLLGWRYVRRAERNERDFAELVERSSGDPVTDAAPGIVAVVAGHRRDPGDRHLGAAVLAAPPATSSSPRARSGPGSTPRAIGGEYLSAASLPRRRRAGARLRRRHALVPGRLDRRLPRAAGPGRRAAAPLGRLHAARLRRGPARLARGSARVCSLLVVAIGWLYLLPQFQGAGLTLQRGDRRARAGSARWSSRVVVLVNVAVRRDAQHHLRAGLPVLAQAHRAAGPGRGPARRLGRRRRARPGRRRPAPAPTLVAAARRRAAARASTSPTR